MDTRPSRTHVVRAGRAQRTHHAREAQGIQLLLVQRQVFHAPADLFAGHDLALAEALLRPAHGFDGQRLDDDATGVEHGTDLVLRTRALALAMHIFQDVLDHLGLLARGVERQRVVALGTFTHVLDVRLGTGPPHAVHLVARVTRGLGFLERGGVHHTPAPQQHVVRAALAHLQPGGLLLHAGGGHRQQLQVEAMHARALLQQRDRLLAEGAVVVDQRDLLALELVQAAFLLAQMLDDDVGGGPVTAHEGEVPLERHAVLRDGQAVTQRDQRDLVLRHLLGQRKGDAGGLRIKQRHAGAALEALVALHTAVGGVAGLALLERQLHAVDAAIAGIDHLQVVLLAIGPRHAVGRVGAGTVRQQREELFLGLRLHAGRERRQAAREGCGGNHQFR